MIWLQRVLTLQPRPRGFHLITDEVLRQVPEIGTIETGLLHLFLQHTSASLSINENASPEVRRDLEQVMSVLAPEGAPYYRHNDEGPDDMPAHAKASLLGVQISIPIARGRLLLGTWQGIFLGEHRNHGGSRRVVATLQGSETT